MTDLHSRFRAYDSVPVPDLWPDVLSRAETESEAAQPNRWWLAVIATVILAALVGGALLGSGLIPLPGPSETPEPSSSSLVSSPSASAPSSADPSQAAGPLEITWNVTGIEPTASISGLAFADGQWFALGMRDLGGFGEEDGTRDAAIWRSDDGRSWVPAEIRAVDAEGDYSVVIDLVELDGVLVAIGSWGAMQSDQLAWVTWRSTDGGASWTENRDSPGPFGALQAITTGGPGLIGAGWTYAGTTPFDSYIVTSRDGIIWEEVGAPLTLTAIHDLAPLGDRVVAVGSSWIESPSGVDERQMAWYSDDSGETWTAGDSAPVSAQVGTPQDLVQFGAGLVAVGGAVDVASWVTFDGGAWDVFEVASSAESFAVAALDTGLVAVGNTHPTGPSTWTSTDARTWSAGPELADNSVRMRAAAGNGDVVIVGGVCDIGGCPTVLWRGEVVR
jgi:hypothetical protein